MGLSTPTLGGVVSIFQSPPAPPGEPTTLIVSPLQSASLQTGKQTGNTGVC